MKAVSDYRANWAGRSGLPELNQRHWSLLAVPAVVLLVMALLQLISFGKFKDWLDSIKVGWPAVVAVLVIIAELWGAVSLTKLNMNQGLRFFGVAAAVLVAGFWFVENAQLLVNGGYQDLHNSGFFGNFLRQTPGWWTMVEASLLLFWIVYAAELLKWRPSND